MSERIWVLGAAVIIAAAMGLACANDPQNSVTAPTTTTRSAVMSSAPLPDPFIAYRENDFGRPPGSGPGPAPSGPLPPAPPTLAAVPASQHPGHFKHEIAAGKDATTPAPAVAGARTDSIVSQADLVAKQQAFEARWRALAPTIANLPADQQAVQRAALKQQVAGAN